MKTVILRPMTIREWREETTAYWIGPIKKTFAHPADLPENKGKRLY
jgi:hypothetical protein